MGIKYIGGGRIWGSQAQMESVKKAAEASAAKRRLAANIERIKASDAAGRLPSSQDVIANAVNYPSQAHYSQALNEARRRERVAAGGPATIPKGKMLGADGKLKDATPKLSDIMTNDAAARARLNANIARVRASDKEAADRKRLNENIARVRASDAAGKKERAAQERLQANIARVRASDAAGKKERAAQALRGMRK